MAYNIAVIVGSLRRDSFNQRLAQGISKLAPADFSFSAAEDKIEAARGGEASTQRAPAAAGGVGAEL